VADPVYIQLTICTINILYILLSNSLLEVDSLNYSLIIYKLSSHTSQINDSFHELLNIIARKMRYSNERCTRHESQVIKARS